MFKKHRLPRTRGDEPENTGGTTAVLTVCPAHAGMSPGVGTTRDECPRLPRTRGDEPPRR